MSEVIDFSFLGGSFIHRSDIVGSSDRGVTRNMQTSQPVSSVHGQAVNRSRNSALIVAAAASAGSFGYRGLHRPTCVTGDGSSALRLLELRPTSHVADVGAGDGAFAGAGASRVVVRKQVFATELGEEDVAKSGSGRRGASTSVRSFAPARNPRTCRPGAVARFPARRVPSHREACRDESELSRCPSSRRAACHASISSRRGFSPPFFLSMAYSRAVVGAPG